MIRLLHIADVHLGASMSPFGDLAERRRGEVLAAFRELHQIARSEGVHAVVVAGDLFDGPEPDRRTRALVAETFARIIKDGRPVLVAPGNHDSPTLHPHPYTDSLGGAYVFLSAAFERVSVETPEGPLHVYGLAYDRAQEPEPLGTYKRADKPGIHLVLVHGSADFSPHWEIGGNALRLPMDVLQDFACDYIALGDYHGFRPPESFAGDASIPACYPGSFAALNLKEVGPRGYVVVELNVGGQPEVSRRSSAVPILLDVGDIDVGATTDHDQVIQRIAERVEDQALPLVRLVGVPDFPLDDEAISLRLCERFGFARVEDTSTFYSSQRLDEVAAGDTVASHVVRLARQQIEAASGDGQHAIGERALRLALQALKVS